MPGQKKGCALQLFFWALLFGCVPESTGPVRADAVHLRFAETAVGTQRTRSVGLSNQGSTSLRLDVSVTAPFEVDASTLELGAREALELPVRFSPLVQGHVGGELRVGTLVVSLEGEGIAVPVCAPGGSCSVARFDAVTQTCLERAAEDGTDCSSRCFAGVCTAGTCVRSPVDCDDGNACTTDSCDEVTGCTRTAVSCDAGAGSCETASCDPAVGCLVRDLPDGTLQGPDDCGAPQVDLCVAGARVTRSRPETGRCRNRWVPATLPIRDHHAMAWDEARGRMVLFGGGSYLVSEYGDTWEYDGHRWDLRTPAFSPSPRQGHRLAWDAVRRRVVLFGGGAGGAAGNETWEWDGRSWLRFSPSRSPSPRSGHTLTGDPLRGRVLLFGGRSAPANDAVAWEWDGADWTPITTNTPALGNHGAAYERASASILLHGASSEVASTWAWDGSTFARRPVTQFPIELPDIMMAEAPDGGVLFHGTKFGGPVPVGETWSWSSGSWTRSSSPPPIAGASAMAFDSARGRVVRVAGRNQFSVATNTTWEWDGQTWATRDIAPSRRNGAAIAWVSACACVVLFGGEWNGADLDDTWEWTGQWRRLTPPVSPPARSGHSLAWDENRQRLVLFGGSSGQTDTWEWDGSSWLERTPATPSPSPRASAALAYDATHREVILFGGAVGVSTLDDTWAWDGTVWVERPASPPPARAGHSMAWQGSRQRLALFGGSNATGYFADLWEWDGSTWAEVPAPAGPSARAGASLFEDPRTGHLLVSGGGNNTLPLQDVWEWNGLGWTSRPPAGHPPFLDHSVATFDSARGRLFLFSVDTAWEYFP